MNTIKAPQLLLVHYLSMLLCVLIYLFYSYDEHPYRKWKCQTVCWQVNKIHRARGAVIAAFVQWSSEPNESTAYFWKAYLKSLANVDGKHMQTVWMFI